MNAPATSLRNVVIGLVAVTSLIASACGSGSDGNTLPAVGGTQATSATPPGPPESSTTTDDKSDGDETTTTTATEASTTTAAPATTTTASTPTTAVAALEPTFTFIFEPGAEMYRFDNSTVGGVDSVTWKLPEITKTGPRIYRRFPTPGAKEVTMTVKRGAQEKSVTQTISYVQVPVAEVKCTATGLKVACENASTGGPFSGLEIQWDAATKDSNATHVYAAAGDVNITLFATNTRGTDSATVTLTLVAPPKAVVTCTSTGLTIDCKNDSFVAGDTVKWLVDKTEVTGATATAERLQYKAPRSGDFSVELVITNVSGTSTATQVVAVVDRSTS